MSNAVQRQSTVARANLLPQRTARAAIIRNMARKAAPAFLLLALAASVFSVYIVQARKVWEEDAQLEARLELSRSTRPIFRAKPAVKAKLAPAPFAYLGRLKITGVFGDGRNSVVMLSAGGDSRYTARDGQLLDSNEKRLGGVASRISGETLILTTEMKEQFSIKLPK